MTSKGRYVDVNIFQRSLSLPVINDKFVTDKQTFLDITPPLMGVVQYYEYVLRYLTTLFHTPYVICRDDQIHKWVSVRKETVAIHVKVIS